MDISPVSRGLTNFFNMYCQRQDGLTGFFMRTCRRPLLALPFSSTLVRHFGYRDYTRCVALLGAAAVGAAVYALCKWARKENTPQAIAQAEKPLITAKKSDTIALSVYISEGRTAPIGKDRKFKFAERIQLIDDSPIKIESQDFYVELVVLGKALNFPDAKGGPWSNLFLPSCLFKDKKDGDVVEFIYDGKKIVLRLGHVAESDRFEVKLANLQVSSEYTDLEALFQEDCGDRPKFFGEKLGDSCIYWGGPDVEKTWDAQDLEFYKNDSNNFTTYQELTLHEILKLENGGCAYYFDVPYSSQPLAKDLSASDFRMMYSGISEEDIHFIRSPRKTEPDDLWILIPHKNKKENNTWPEDGSIEISGHAKQIFFVQGHGWSDNNPHAKEFRPNTSDHLNWYHHGQYKKLTILRDQEVKIGKVQWYGRERLMVTFCPKAK